MRDSSSAVGGRLSMPMMLRRTIVAGTNVPRLMVVPRSRRRVEVAGEAGPVERQAERLQRIAVVEALHPERGRAALADDLAGDALAKVTLAVAVGQQRRARLALHVDEARRTTRPVASMTRPAATSARSPIRVMRSPTTPTSARCGGWPVPSMTCPPRTIRSKRCAEVMQPARRQVSSSEGATIAGRSSGRNYNRWTISVSHTVSAFLHQRTRTRGLFSADDYAQMRAFFDAPPQLAATPTTRPAGAGRATSGSARCAPRTNRPASA